jgi:shikimate kinase
MTPVRPAIRHVALVGLMGSGKSTVGTRVAARLGWPFRDSDADIEAREGSTVRELQARLGTDGMHRLEAHQLLEALADERASVVGAAASVAEDAACLAALRHDEVLVAWARVSPEVAARRFSSARHRPTFGDDPATFLADQARRRDPAFASVADLVLDADTGDPDELAESVVEVVVSRAARARER